MDLKVKEVAELLGMHSETARTMARSGDFPNAYKTGPKKAHHVRIPSGDVEDYSKRQPKTNGSYRHLCAECGYELAMLAMVSYCKVTDNRNWGVLFNG